MARNPTRRSKLGLDEEETANDIRSRFASSILNHGKMVRHSEKDGETPRGPARSGGAYRH
jgi:hypothetical protein